MGAEPGDRKAAERDLVANRRAFREYQILEKLEAGLELLGPEVKSIRDGRVSLAEAFADIHGGQAFLRDCRVEPYAHSRRDDFDPVRPKRLLLKRVELDRLVGHTAVKGRTLIPLRLYLRRGFIKLELGLGVGRQLADKREVLKRRTHEREAAREIAARRRG
jgi:SsrA-binding protein